MLLTVLTVKNLKFEISKVAVTAVLKIENWHISATVSAISTKFGTVVQFLTVATVTNFTC